MEEQEQACCDSAEESDELSDINEGIIEEDNVSVDKDPVI